MKALGYEGVGLGDRDFLCGGPLLRELRARLDVPFIASNLRAIDGGPPYGDQFRVIERRVGGRTLRIGVFSVADSRSSLWTVVGAAVATDPVAAAREIVLSLQGRVDLVIGMAQMSRQAADDLVREVPGIDLLLVGHETSPRERWDIIGRTVAVEVGTMGKQLRVVDWLFAPEGKEGGGLEETLLVPLDESVEDDTAMAALVKEYEETMAGRRARDENAVAYVGSESCAPCHRSAHDLWKESAHPRAHRTLDGAGFGSAHGCLPCHTTGYGERGGFTSAEETPAMAGIGCESCHGPGGRHVTAHAGGARPADGGGESRLVVPGEGLCISCHDAENDPDFDPRAAMAAIAHGRPRTAR
jgi:hypothetical protein